MRQISVTIITQNEEDFLVKAVKSCLSFADEIVVVDGGSKDNTVERAQALGCSVYINPWPGFAPQRKFGVAKAKHDWIFLLDSDEIVSDELAAAIQQWKVAPELDASVFEVRRINQFFEHWLDGHVEYMARLYNKNLFEIKDVLVHEGLYIGDAKLSRLPGPLWHDSFRGVHDSIERLQKYTTLEAQQNYLNGKRFNALRLLLKPPARFVQRYIVRRTFTKGMAGFTYAIFWVFWDFLREVKLYEID